MRFHFLIFILSFCVAGNTTNAQVPPPQSMLKGEILSIPQYDFEHLKPLLHPNNDTTYIINFWATWCMPCVQELPEFEKLNDSFVNKPVRVVLVSLDLYKDAARSLPNFIIHKHIKSKVLFLHPVGNSWIDEVDEKWDGALPVTLICNRNHRIFINSTVSYQNLIDNLNKIIKP